MAPLKCGTRYLRSLGLSVDHIHLTDEDWYRSFEIKWEMFIIKPPLDQLKSALQTELLNLYNGHDLWNGMDIESVLDRFITPNGCDHWSGNLYEKLYNLWVAQGKVAKIVPIQHISYFISEMGHYIPFDKNKYNFSNFKIWKSKDDILEMVKFDFPNHHKKLIEMTDGGSVYYNKFNLQEIKKNIL
jgi:hypothetical protein